MSLPVAPFETDLHIEMGIDLDDADDDQRRAIAEWWCCDQAKGAWFRSVDKRAMTVRFSFEDYQDAIRFWLAN